MTVLVFGADGQLGRALRTKHSAAIFLTRADCDLTEPGAVGRTLQDAQPLTIINAEAYTAVDRAEAA